MGESMDATVIEFGNAVTYSNNLLEVSPEVDKLLEYDIKKHEALLNHLKLVEYTEPFHIVEGPPLDKLNRFNVRGWRGSFAAPGYTAFAAHFRCKREHFNSNPDLKYIWRMIKLWFSNKFTDEELY